jgi:hypothetical protein
VNLFFTAVWQYLESQVTNALPGWFPQWLMDAVAIIGTIGRKRFGVNCQRWVDCVSVRVLEDAVCCLFTVVIFILLVSIACFTE